MPRSTSGTRLVADIGGTHTRLALYDPADDALRAHHRYINRDYTQLEDILADWMGKLEEPHPTEACLAVAAPPPFDKPISMINIDWTFSIRHLADTFGLEQLHCLNDFQGNAYGLPYLTAETLVTLNGDEQGIGNKLATVGPGTGLGGSTLEQSGPTPIACASEPGHMGLAPANSLEISLLEHLQARHGEVYAELLLCGPGMVRLYHALAEVQGKASADLAQEDISSRGLSGECELCHQTLHTFCALLGSLCGDFVLANGAYGGLYVAGGIMPKLLDFLGDSTFSRRFREKGKMEPVLTKVPLHIITGDTTGLLGAAHAPLHAPR